MPVVLAGAIVSATLGSAASATVVAGITVGGLLTTVIATGLSLALSMALAPKPKREAQTGQVATKDSNPRLVRGYGRMKLGGSVFVQESVSGILLFIGQVHCEGPINAIEQWFLNDTLTAIPAGSYGGGSGVMPWLDAVVVESRYGTPDQPWSEIGIPGWSPAHQGKGLAYSIVKCTLPPRADKFFQRTFPNGAPSLRVVARLSYIYDPRSGQTLWARNAALCIRDYLVNVRTDATGRQWSFIPPSRIDDNSFALFANVCDEGVSLKAGGTEPRYSLDGVYDLTEEPRDVLRRMLATCDAELVQLPNGKVGIRGGKWEEPTVILTDRHFITFEYVQGNDKLSAFNQLKWSFVDPANDYQVVDGDPWDDDANQNERGEVLVESLDLVMVQSHTQGRRLAKIATAKRNPRHHLSDCVVQLPALLLFGQRMVRVHLAAIGLNEVFVINRFVPADDLSTVTLDLSSISADAYAWNPATEEGTPPSAATAGGEVITTPGLINIVVGQAVQDLGGGATYIKPR